ncbi:MAG: hypothetical protein Kow0088_22140 [Anaerolineales bacterium]
MHKDLEHPLDALHAKKPKRLPTILTREEVQHVLTNLSGTNLLMARLLYGCGLRLMECIRLRVKDIDFRYRTITVRDARDFGVLSMPVSPPDTQTVGRRLSLRKT